MAKAKAKATKKKARSDDGEGGSSESAATGLDVVRFPLPKESGDIVNDTLDVENLSVVVGACVMPALADDHDDLDADMLDAHVVTVDVDGADVLDAPVSDVLGAVGEKFMWRTCEDPVVLTPREEGVEVSIALDRLGHGKKWKLTDPSRWELWLFVAR